MDRTVAGAVTVLRVAVGRLGLHQPTGDLLEKLLYGGHHDLLDVCERGLVLIYHGVSIKVPT